MTRPGLLVTLSLLVSSSPASAEPSPTTLRAALEAVATDDAIELDGRLDEVSWQRAPVADGFSQREPEPGEPASERTEVRVVYTRKTLYIGVRAFDRAPEAIIAREMQRDGSLSRDDAVALYLDTFDDDRNAYVFETNPNGARRDCLVSGEGRDTNCEWDGVWDVAAQITVDGWVAEIAIPFATLRFDPAAGAWGFNVRRLIRHKNEEVFWAPIGLDAERSRVSLYGALLGIERTEPGLDLDVMPFLVAAAADTAQPVPDEGSAAEDLNAGLDVKWGLTQGWSLDLTFNTDFAEVEVDDQRVNLTRFSLFFPEKRDFFLENAGIFDFGPESSGGTPLLKIFFSRRIGIGEGGREVPIEWGARVTGRTGAWNIGMLNVRTEAVVPGEGGPGEEKVAARDDWRAARLQRNLGQRSSLGLIFTHRASESEGQNRVYGADFDWKPTETLAVAGFFSRSRDSDLPSGDDWAAGLGVERRGSIWNWSAGYTEIGERFEPEMGFLRRRGVRRFTGEVDFEPRPEIDRVRNLSFELEAEVITRRDGTTESSELELEPFGLRFDSEDRFSLLIERNFERLFEPFEIVPGVVIPSGDYTFHEYGARFESNRRRRLRVKGSVRWSDFFGGDRFRAEMTLGARTGRFVHAEATWEHNTIDVPQGAFTTNVARQKLKLAWNPHLLTDTLLQYNDLDESLAFNLRCNWIYKPGTEVFVLFQQTWNAPSFDRLQRRDRRLIVKLTYLFQR